MYKIKFQGGAEIQIQGNKARVVNRNGHVVLDWTTYEACQRYCKKVYGKEVY